MVEVVQPPSVGVKGKRRLEVLGFILSAVLLALGIVFYLVSKHTNSSEDMVVRIPCEKNSTQYQVNITEGYNRRFPNGSVLGGDKLMYSPKAYWVSDLGEVWGCPCSLKPCVHKCCNRGEGHLTQDILNDYGELDRLARCRKTNNSFRIEDRKIHSTDLQEVKVDGDYFYTIVTGKDLSCDNFALNEQGVQNAFLLKDGRLFRNDSIMKPFFEYTEYCVESRINSSSLSYLVCLPSVPQENRSPLEHKWVYWTKSVVLAISVPCLIATSLVYTMLPQLRNLHGKSLVFHVTSLAVGYSCIALVHVWGMLPSVFCTTVGYLIQFSILTSFFWLNVMCFDLWWVFSGLKPLRGSQKDVESRKFLWYSCYAWGGAGSVLLVTLAMDYAPNVPSWMIRPHMGVSRCFFIDDDARLLYLYLPMAVLVYLNCLMFLTTALRLRRHSQLLRGLERHCQGPSDLQRFSLYLKLFLVMGVNWSLEFLSFYMGGGTSDVTLFLLLADLGNALQGVLILVLFVCKKPLLRQLHSKLCPARTFGPMFSSRKTSSTSVPSSQSVKIPLSMPLPSTD